VDYMWPLDQTLRGLAPGEDTQKILSLPFYGPFLHLWAWRLDPDPDWFLVDLWHSGVWGARLTALTVWVLFLGTSLALLWGVVRRRNTKSRW
jgi:hypothetical protein